MKKNLFPLVAGSVLILIGLTSLAANVLLKAEAWRFWPVIVILAGLGLTAPALFSFKVPGLGAFFIPGLPVLTTGGILMAASLTGNWGIWAWAWSLIMIALGLAFALAAFPLRAPGLAIPAVILGVNGAFLAFCAVTGLWVAWALMWPIEPLAVGIGLLILGVIERSSGTKLAGSILCGIAGAGFFIASFITIFDAGLLRFAVPAMLMLTGLILVAAYLFRTEKPAKSELVDERPIESAG
ncbi:MAG: hypothetical protein AB1846_17600 [Chloroflexota bacterium]